MKERKNGGTSQNRKKRKQIDKGTWSTKFNSSLVNLSEKNLVGNIYFFKLRKRRLGNSNQHFNNNNFPQGEGKLEIANNHFKNNSLFLVDMQTLTSSLAFCECVFIQACNTKHILFNYFY